MKYFSAESYVRFNENDGQEADTAHTAWERAILEYRRYLKEHRDMMPTRVRMLAEKTCLHDALLLGRQMHRSVGQNGVDSRRLLTIGLQLGGETIVLNYFLCDSPKEFKPKKDWPFSKDQLHWLYDEVAVNEDGHTATAPPSFVHRVLLSDGSELEIPFIDLILDRFRLRTSQDVLAVASRANENSGRRKRRAKSG
jgi:hypothetical protein